MSGVTEKVVDSELQDLFLQSISKEGLTVEEFKSAIAKVLGSATVGTSRV